MAKIEKNIFNLNLTSVFWKTNSKFEKKNFLLRGRTTLPLWFEPKHNYEGSAVTEWIY